MRGSQPQLIPSVARRRQCAKDIQKAADYGDPVAAGIYLMLTHIGALDDLDKSAVKQIKTKKAARS